MSVNVIVEEIRLAREGRDRHPDDNVLEILHESEVRCGETVLKRRGQ